MQAARNLDQKLAAGRKLSPLHGVPILIKDNIETRELPTTAGSLALVDNDTGRDAPVVAKLRRAGLVSRTGIVPISHSQDTTGPMATNVRDAAYLLTVMVAHDSTDPASEAAKGRFGLDYSTALKADGLTGKRIGVARSVSGFHPGADQRLAQAVADLTRAAIDDLLRQHELDLLIAPSEMPAWPIRLEEGDPSGGGNHSFPAISGYPHLTVPMGDVDGLPVGLSFFGTAFSEMILIEPAFAYEQATGHARPPSGFAGWQPAVSEKAGNQNPSSGGIPGEATPVPLMVGDSARRQVAESKEGEGDTRQ